MLASSFDLSALSASAPIVAGAVALLTAGAATGGAAWAARRLRLLAHPVERSSHSVPTPQVGGVGICLAFLVVLALAPRAGVPWNSTTGFIAAAIVWGLALGLIDDVLAIAALPKLGGQAILAALVAQAARGICLASNVGATPWLVDSPAGFVLLFCWVLLFINAYNFMDGVNGQSAVFGLSALGWWSLVWMLREGALALGAREFGFAWMAAVAAALVGFLPWNFPRPQTFMGDCGSLPIGALLGAGAFLTAGGQVVPLVGTALPLSVYVYDVLYTLVRRIRRRENILKAHRSHLYQRMLVATGWSHARLLLFHLPFYLGSGAAALLFDRAAAWPVRALLLAGVGAGLVLYTRLVLGAEARALARRFESK